MSNSFRIIILLFLSINILTIKIRLRQPAPVEIGPPVGGTNETNISPTSNVTESGNNITRGGNITGPFGGRLRQAPSNNISEGQGPENITGGPETGNITGEQGPENITGGPALPPAAENITGGPVLPPGAENFTEGLGAENRIEGPVLPSGTENITGGPIFPAGAENITGGPLNITGQPSAAKNISDAATEPLIAGGISSPSSTVVSVSQPVISVIGEATGNIPSDLIKIGVKLENPKGNAEEALNENQQRVQDLLSKLNQINITQDNIINLGQALILRKKKLKSESIGLIGPNAQGNVTGGEEQGLNNQTSNEGNQTQGGNEISATSQLEIQVDNINAAAKVIDLLKSLNYTILYLDYDYKESTLGGLINNLVDSALKDADAKARAAITGKGYDLGQIINMNVILDKKFIDQSDNTNQDQQETGNTNPQGLRIVKVILSITYSLVQGGGAPPGEVIPQPPEQPQPPEKPQPPEQPQMPEQP